MLEPYLDFCQIAGNACNGQGGRRVKKSKNNKNLLAGHACYPP